MRSRRSWIAAVVLWAAGLGLVPLANRSVPAPELILSTAALPVAGTHGVAIGDHVVANGPDPYIVLTAPARPVRTVRLTLVSGKGNLKDFWMYYIPQLSPRATPFNSTDVAPAQVAIGADGWRVDWELPTAARAWRIDVPDDADFRVVSLEAWNTPGAGSTDLDGVARSALILLAATLLTGAGIVIVWRPGPPALWRADAVWVALLAIPLTIIVFLLPPFEGPDENYHWMLAVAVSRPPLTSEPTAFQLPEVLRPVAYKPAPDRMNMGPVPPMSAADITQRLRFIHANYPYARPWSYPLTTLVMWLYPRVDSIRQAVLLFYLCRLLPALVLLGCLLYAVRRYEVLFTTLVFFSLPLVVEQHVVISTDILLNLGALVMALLFLRHRRDGNASAAVGLWLLALTILSVKFIYAPLLLLPVLTLPRGTPRRALFAGGAVLAVAATYPALLLIKHQVRAYAATVNRLPLADQQIAALAHASGWHELLAQYGRYVGGLFDVAAWSGPLGWLYAPLSPAHLTLIAVSVVVAVAFDVWQIATRWSVWKRVLAIPLFVGLGGLVFVTFIDVLLYHLMTTSPGAAEVAGVQVRHFFPIVIASLAIAAPVRIDPVAGTRAWTRAFALAALGGLLIVRSVQLAQDLLICFW